MSTDFIVENIPIEFKQINPSDFSEHYNVSNKTIIAPNEDGFISNSITPILKNQLETKNTIVINAGVGQGKSKSIIDLIGDYTEKNEYVVLVTVPFKNLVSQYVAEISDIIEGNKIFNILDIDNVDFDNYDIFEKYDLSKKFENIFKVKDTDFINIFNIEKYKVHVLTINSLLGNPGEGNLLQAKKRTKYFNKLYNYCESRNKKIILILDEVHDSISSFKEKYIYSLWKYQGLIQKIFVISATFNEASKEVIKYLSEFTDRNIEIFESERKIIADKQSKLHLNFYSGYNIESDENLIKLLKNFIDEGKEFDMMVYSKSLTKKFLEKPNHNSKSSKVSHLFYDIKDRFNRCYSDIFDPERANKKYNPSQSIINIGTNFSTGISIKKENHKYIIIFPKDVFIKHLNNKGVFTQGYNTIIQAIARLRTKGDIYLFLPRPAMIRKESFPYEDLLAEKIVKIFEKYYDGTSDFVEYSNINKQSEEINEIYSVLYNKLSTARQKLSQVDRFGMNRLIYRPKEIFVLEEGESYLTEKFFNGNLSSYILWASICNQFLNCRLNSISHSNILNLSLENLDNQILEIYNNEKNLLNNLSLSYYELLQYFDKWFFDSYEILIDQKAMTNIEKITITNKLVRLITNTNNISKKEFTNKYLKSCIYYSNIVDTEEYIYLNDYQKEIILLFQKFRPFIELLESKKEKLKNGFKLPNNPFSEFEDLFSKENIKEVLENLRIKERFLSSEILTFNDTYKRYKTDKHYLNAFYKLLINCLYNGKLKSSTKTNKSIYHYALEQIEFKESELFNLLYRPFPEYTL